MINKKIIIFGASEKNYAEQIVKKYGEQIVYCIDNDVNKHNTKFMDKYTIYPIEKILEEEKGTYIVITSAIYYYNKMAAQLMTMGLEKNKDFVFAGDILDIDSLKECWEKNRRRTDINIKPELRVLHLEYSGACNLKCIYCPFHGVHGIYKDHTGLMTFDTLKTTVEKFKNVSTIETLDLCGHGEIFINKYWYEFTDYILTEMSIKKVIIYTNGMLLTEENAQKLAQLKRHNIKLCLEVSIDGSTPEENNGFRLNSDYKTIKNNIYNALKYLSEEDINIANAFIIGEDELKRRDYDVSFSINVPEFILKDFSNIYSFSRPVYNKRPNDKMILLDKEYSNSKVYTKYKSPVCNIIFDTLAINNKGHILLCQCLASGISFLGNIFDNDPVDVFYNNTELNSIRNMVKNGETPKSCYLCTTSPMQQYIVLCNKK